MQTPKSFRPHGGVRGANLSRSSLLFSGPFGRMFRAVPPADYGNDDATAIANLTILAKAMTSPRDEADPKDGPDNEESGLPAVYTYFGQFIDHDLTFDPASSLQKQNDPDALVDYRTPRFDLDNVYGRGPDDQPYLYSDGISFILGEPMKGAASNPGARDLPRSKPGTAHNGKPLPGRAIIGDPRNDENKIVSQLQGLWHRFHNRIASEHRRWTFAEVQQEVRFHYQWILLHDFLPSIIDKKVLAKVLPNGVGNLVQNPPDLKFFQPRDEAFMPLEFSAAAYRFGHSMVRPGYRMNEPVAKDDKSTLLPIFSLHHPDLRGFEAPPDGFAISWERFADIKRMHYGTPPVKGEAPDPNNPFRLQLAYRIDTSLVNPLKFLPPSIASDPPPILGQRNLERGWRMRLPNGQDVARAMGLEPLSEDELQLGKFTGADDDTKAFVQVSSLADGIFTDNCPLWTYILAETRMHIDEEVFVDTLDGKKKIPTPKLGEVGGRIVAETFVGLLMADSSSYVSQQPLWQPEEVRKGGKFGLREMVRQALEG